MNLSGIIVENAIAPSLTARRICCGIPLQMVETLSKV